MPTRTSDDLRDMNFTRDPSLAGDIADAFGGGGGDATALIQANLLRYPELLTVANDLAWNKDVEDKLIEEAGSRKAWYSEVADAAEIESVNCATVRGDDYVVFGFTLADGRSGKDVLYLDEDGSLEAPNHPDTPERAALRAQVTSTRHLRAAKGEAEQIVADAQKEAARILQEASAKAAEETAESLRRSSAAAEDDKGDEPASAGSTETPVATGAGSTEDIDALGLEDAKKRAEGLGLDVTGTGSNGTIKKSDYHDALKKHAAA